MIQMTVDFDAVVWVADDGVADGLDYGVRLIEGLNRRGLTVHRADLTVNTRHVPQAHLHVLSGGGTPVSEPTGWMPSALRLVGNLIDGARRGEHSLLGVCLGSQMISQVLQPGSIGETNQIEVGLTEVAWSPNQHSLDALVVPTFHYESIRPDYLSESQRVVATCAMTPVQAFTAGPRIWATQFHPELRPSDLRELITYHRKTIEAYGGDFNDALASVGDLEPRWSPTLFDRIVDTAFR
jgi:GMP synthase-like glutamine amidotransferase